MSEETRCPICDRILATSDDNKKYPEGGGEHLCWRRFANDTCEGEPIDWRMRYLTAEARVKELEEENAFLKTLADGHARDSEGFHVAADNESVRAEKAEAERDEAIKALGKEGKLRGQVEAERDALKAKLVKEEKACTQLIDERDMRENQVTAIARALGVTSEWSNMHDLGVEALEAIDELRVEITALKEQIEKLHELGEVIVHHIAQAGPLAWMHQEHTVDSLKSASDWEKKAVKLMEEFAILGKKASG